MSFEIDVTHLVTSEDCSEFSSSIAERGQNAGPETWANAVAFVKEKPLAKPENQSDLRDWIREFGAWDDEEIAAMTDDDTNALLLQFVAGDIREMKRFDSPEEYQAAQEAGTCSGYLSHDVQANPPRWLFYVGH